MRSRRGISVLAMCSLALGLMAITTSGAQAGMWMVNGKNVGSGVELKVGLHAEIESIGETGEKYIELEFSFEKNLKFKCKGVTISAATITLEVFKATATYSGCMTYISGKAQGGCAPEVVANVQATAVLHEGKPYARFEGQNGVLATLRFDEETCIFSPLKVTGSVWVEEPKGKFEFEDTLHLIQEGKLPTAALGGLFIGANKIVVNGSAVVSFNDAEHIAFKFSGLAE